MNQRRKGRSVGIPASDDLAKAAELAQKLLPLRSRLSLVDERKRQAIVCTGRSLRANLRRCLKASV